MRPDLLVLDIMLPQADGRDICRSIRTHARLSSWPVIFLTGRGGELDRALGFEPGADDYIVKPFFMPDLIARIQSLLRRDSAASLGSGQLAPDRNRLEDAKR